jgi:DNA-directed RNA polymerase subunit H
MEVFILCFSVLIIPWRSHKLVYTCINHEFGKIYIPCCPKLAWSSSLEDVLFVVGERLVPPLELIPEHSVLSGSEASRVMKRFNIPIEKFPKMLESDPQAKLLGAKPGDLIAISRKDPTGRYTYYRVVVRG